MGEELRGALIRIRELPILDVVNFAYPGQTFKRVGGNVYALCPFHEEKTPSLCLNTRINRYHCFGCGCGGDSIQFVQELKKLDFLEAVQEISGGFGIVFENDLSQKTDRTSLRKTLFSIYQDSAEYYHKKLSEADSDIGVAKSYLLSRVREGSINKLRLGYAAQRGLLGYLRSKYPLESILESGLVKESQERPGEYYDFFRRRVLFPIRDRPGRVIAFAGRSIDGSDPKYINSQKSLIYPKSKILFGLDGAESFIRKEGRVYVFEGYIDAIVGWEHGIGNCVAIGGISLTFDQLKTLSGISKNITLCLDADKSGWNKAQEIGKTALSEGVSIDVLNLGGGDPDEFLRKYGGQKFRELAKEKKGLLEFAIDVKNLKKISNPDEKYTVIRELYDIIDSQKSPLQKSLWLRSLAKDLNLNFEVLVKDYNSHLGEIRRGYTNQRSTEEYLLGFLANNPTYRRVAKQRFLREDFSKSHYGLFFEFLCSGVQGNNFVIRPDVHLSGIGPLFDEPNLKSAIGEFRQYCDDASVIVHEEQLNELEGMLILSKNNNSLFIDRMDQEVKNKWLSASQREIEIALKEGGDISDLLGIYHKKLNHNGSIRNGVVS